MRYFSATLSKGRGTHDMGFLGEYSDDGLPVIGKDGRQKLTNTRLFWQDAVSVTVPEPVAQILHASGRFTITAKDDVLEAALADSLADKQVITRGDMRRELESVIASLMARTGGDVPLASILGEVLPPGKGVGTFKNPAKDNPVAGSAAMELFGLAPEQSGYVAKDQHDIEVAELKAKIERLQAGEEKPKSKPGRPRKAEPEVVEPTNETSETAPQGE